MTFAKGKYFPVVTKTHGDERMRRSGSNAYPDKFVFSYTLTPIGASKFLNIVLYT